MDKASVQAKIEETKQLIAEVEYDLYMARTKFSEELLRKGISDLQRRLEKYQMDLTNPNYNS